MATLVSLVQVNDALRLDLAGSAPAFGTDERSTDILLKIKQAEDICLDFVQPKPEPTWTADDAPGQVTAAIIITIKCLLDDTDDSLAMISGLSGMNVDQRNPIAALLWRLRKPSLA